MGLSVSGRPTAARRGTTASPPARRRQGHPPHTQETGAPPQRTSAGGTAPPIESLPPAREQAADPRKAARRRAPPLAAGTPEDSIARAGGRASQGPDPRKGPQGGGRPRHHFFDCDIHNAPGPTTKKRGAEAPLSPPTGTKSRPVRRSSPRRIPRRQAPRHLSWLESAVRCSGTHHGTGTHPGAG